MEINEKKVADRLLIGVQGRLDSATSSLLEARLNALIEGGEKQFVIDCSQLHYLSSAGLRVWLATVKKIASKGGRILLAAAKSHVLEVVHLGGFDGLFPHFTTVEAALAA